MRDFDALVSSLGQLRSPQPHLYSRLEGQSRPAVEQLGSTMHQFTARQAAHSATACATNLRHGDIEAV